MDTIIAQDRIRQFVGFHVNAQAGAQVFQYGSVAVRFACLGHLQFCYFGPLITGYFLHESIGPCNQFRKPEPG